MDELFVSSLALTLFFILRWGFRELPKERWQFLGAVPQVRLENGSWRSVNFTVYGLINASGCAFSSGLLLLLLGSVSISATAAEILFAISMAVCLPSSRAVAKVVEKKPGTFTVGGAFFIGILVLPGITVLLDRFYEPGMPYMAVMGAFCVAYALGEGLGRLSCISFGCCYGKPLTDAGPLLKRLFSKRCFVFCGETKKIAYAGGLAGREVIPIQAMTSSVLCVTGIVGLYLFLKGYDRAAFLGVLTASQGWRFISEFFRADYRGGGRISAYQLMAIAAIGYGFLLTGALPESQHPAPDLGIGFSRLWSPESILLLQGLWLAVFVYLGKSRTTSAVVSFHVEGCNI